MAEKGYTFKGKLEHLLFEYHYPIGKTLQYAKAITTLLGIWSKQNDLDTHTHPSNHHGLGCG